MEIYEEIREDREKGARRMVAEYRVRLTTAARMLCSDVHTAEDLVFRAFERAILKIDEFRPTGSFYYWIYSILLNFHRMDLRKRSSRPETIGIDGLPEREDENDPFAEFVFRGSAEAVRNAVTHLPAEFREVVVLRYFEEMSTPEIAKVAGIPEGTVRSRLHYAKNALHAMLADTELSPDFADRLVKATRQKSWLFRRISVASVALLLSFALFAAGSAAVARLRAGGEAAVPGAAGAESGTALWRVAASSPVFTPEADEIDRAVEAGIRYIVSQQKPDGSFSGSFGKSAAIPALAGMAILSKGHLPGTEPYGETLLKCLDYVLTTPDLRFDAKFRGYMGAKDNGRMYAHSIATLFLAEMSGMVDSVRQAKIDAVLPLAVKVILDAQNQKKSPEHFGGWRYTPDSNDSDLSCSGWALMALRSVRLNGAELPSDAIEKAVLYVKRSQREDRGAFSYQGRDGRFGETLTGAGILCLELCGKHLDPASLKAAEYLKREYDGKRVPSGNVHYGLYYTAQGLFQLGGEYWKSFEKWMHSEFLRRQRPDGSWCGQGDEGNPVYATAMTVLAFTVPYRMLPIYQRDETVDDDQEGKEK